MQKIVINACFGGFNLSHKAIMRYAELKGIKLYPWIDDVSKKIYKERATINNPDILIHYCTIPIKNEDEYNNRTKKKDDIYWSPCDLKRDDPTLRQVVEELDKKANTHCSNLKVVSIPDKVKWVIEEYDGNEWIAEEHRTWR